MESWITKYWWLVTGLAGSVALIGFRLRSRGGKENVLRRILFGTFPVSDPALATRRQATGLSAVLVALGVLAVSLAYLWFIESN